MRKQGNQGLPGYRLPFARLHEPKGPPDKKSGPSLERHEVPVEKGERLLELESFLSCVQDATTPKTDGSFGKSALEVALTITREIQSAGNLELSSDFPKASGPSIS